MVYSYANPLAHKDPGSFLVTLDPSTMMLTPNAAATSTVTVTSISGFTGTVTLSLSYPGTSLTASVTPTSLTVPLNGAAKSTLSLTAPTTIGNYSILVTGVSTSHSRTTYSSAELTVQVVSSQDFAITSSPNTVTSPMGSTNTTTITVTSVNGYTGTVSLTVTTPFGFITVTGGQNPLTVSSGGSASTTLAITTSKSTPIGNYTLTVTGSSGSRTHTTTITLTVVDPNPVIVEGLSLNSYTFNNATYLTLNLQNIGNGTITLTSYIVRDSSGDAWTLTNYAGPTIGVGQSGAASVFIGSSCPNCGYTGITGLFFQFQPGQTYTVTVTTTRGNQFTFNVVD